MAHNHNHSHNHSEGQKNIVFAFILNLCFAIIELFGGIFTNSIAILSDALHDFMDSISLGIAWYLEKKSSKTRDKFYSYGYKRFSLLGSVFISALLVFGSCFVLFESIKRLFNPEQTNAEGMLLLAILGIVVNGIAVLRVKKGKSLNEKAVYLHLFEDVLGWASVLVVSIVMIFVNLPILDPILSIAICIWVLINAYKNLRQTFKIFLQEVPQDIESDRLQDEVLMLKGVTSIHDFHLWTLDGIHHILSMHIVTSNEITTDENIELKKKIKDLCKQHNIPHATLEMETISEEEECEHC